MAEAEKKPDSDRSPTKPRALDIAAHDASMLALYLIQERLDTVSRTLKGEVPSMLKEWTEKVKAWGLERSTRELKLRVDSLAANINRRLGEEQKAIVGCFCNVPGDTATEEDKRIADDVTKVETALSDIERDADTMFRSIARAYVEAQMEELVQSYKARLAESQENEKYVALLQEGDNKQGSETSITMLRLNLALESLIKGSEKKRKVLQDDISKYTAELERLKASVEAYNRTEETGRQSQMELRRMARELESKCNAAQRRLGETEEKFVRSKKECEGLEERLDELRNKVAEAEEMYNKAESAALAKSNEVEKLIMTIKSTEVMRIEQESEVHQIEERHHKLKEEADQFESRAKELQENIMTRTKDIQTLNAEYTEFNQDIPSLRVESARLHKRCQDQSRKLKTFANLATPIDLWMLRSNANIDTLAEKLNLMCEKILPQTQQLGKIVASRRQELEMLSRQTTSVRNRMLSDGERLEEIDQKRCYAGDELERLRREIGELKVRRLVLAHTKE